MTKNGRFAPSLGEWDGGMGGGFSRGIVGVFSHLRERCSRFFELRGRKKEKNSKKIPFFFKNILIFGKTHAIMKTIYIIFPRVCERAETIFDSGGNEKMAKQKRLNYLVDGIIVHTEFLREGEKIRIIKAPEREGYVFSEWKDHPIFMPATHLNIEAVYVPNAYTLTYLVDGVEVDHALIPYGAKIEPLAAPTNGEFTFSGWQGLPDTMPAHDVTVMGVFSNFPYTLTLMVDDEVFATYQFAAGTDLTDLPEPEREGYDFAGWGKRYKKMPASNLTMKGRFEPHIHKVIFNLDDEYRFEREVATGERIRPVATPERENHTFTGWGTIPEVMPDHDIVFNGYFNINCHPITFKLDGEVIFSDNFDVGTEIAPPEVPVKPGYVFSGWRALPKTMPDAPVEAEGKYYLRRYKLIVKIDGEEVERIPVLFGTAPSAPEAPEKPGFAFAGWEGLPETMPAEDVVVTGRYTEV